jgi:phosphoribosylaminoimidazole-succinocarboxamide synthase
MGYDLPLPLYRGKVRDTYRVPNSDDLLLMVASDRISVYDVILREPVPGKGVVLNHMTRHWFTQTPVGEVAPNHLISCDPTDFPYYDGPSLAGRAMLVHHATMLPIEFIVRGYITGSAWASYQKDGTVNGVELPRGLREMDKFPEPMFTPSTKAEQGLKDENITIERMAEILGDPGLATEAVRISIEAYKAGVQYALERGIVLVDTKFELGFVNGELAICDEVLTPDSSRYVAAETLEVGKPPKSMDKEFVRTWARGTGWDKQPPPPTVPDEVIAQTQEIYGDIAKRLTGVNPIAA